MIQETVSNWISDIRARQRAGRNAKIIYLSRLGWTQEEIAEVVGKDRSVISRIVQNTKFGEMHNFLEQGKDMAWIADHYHIDIPLTWALCLEGKTDQERFEELGWGLRTWDQWSFNTCDERFGDDWPGRIPAQLVGHTLFYFTEKGSLVVDPMAGGGVVADTCLAFNRKCWSFDLVDRPEARPEIQVFRWSPESLLWPVKGKEKPDFLFLDPPYFNKLADNTQRTVSQLFPARNIWDSSESFSL